jgi:Lrp/AsnC family leucine-responsive transcriptional regulator
MTRTAAAAGRAARRAWPRSTQADEQQLHAAACPQAARRHGQHDKQRQHADGRPRELAAAGERGDVPGADQADDRRASDDPGEEHPGRHPPGLSPSACLRRVKALEASGIIAGYHAEVNRARAGLGLAVFIGLRVQRHSRETSSQVEQAVLAIPEVVACYVVSGDDDFLVEAAVPDLASYEQVLLDQILAIGPVNEARSVFAIRTVLSRGPLPLAHWR